MRKRVRAVVAPAEAELAGAWEQAAGAAPLATSGGETLRVRYSGRRNRGPGPDFLDAILETAGGEVRGAVEVHRRSSDWARHGHGADPRYGGVVLHVVAQDDGGRCAAPGGRQLPLLVLGADPRSWPGAAGPPGAACAAPFPCAARARDRSGQSPRRTLVAAGAARFAAATSRLAAARGRVPVEQVAYEEVAAALGYEHNAAPLRSLAAALPLTGLLRAAAADGADVEALLLGSAGLLPSQRHLPLSRRRGETVAGLEAAWGRQRRPPLLRAYRWTAAGRPENAPVRRVLALARLVRRWPPEGLLAATGRILETEPRPARAARAVAGLVAEPPPSPAGAAPDTAGDSGGADYWRSHWDFGVAARTGAGAPLGPSRAADVVVNVLLPLAATERRWRAAARRAYLAHPPLAENWITRLVSQRAALPAAAPAGRSGRPLTAAAQQGLIAVFEATCRDLRCDACPLAGVPPSAPGAAPGSAASGGVSGDGRPERGGGLAGDALQVQDLGVGVGAALGPLGQHPQPDQLPGVGQGQHDAGAAVGQAGQGQHLRRGVF
jgi:hypothetical protein